jgi:hypothetical protein
VDHLLEIRRIRFWLGLFIVGLVLSGLTAFPLQAELNWFTSAVQTGPLAGFAGYTHLLTWLQRVTTALGETNARYPFLAYGTDWLAFAHLVIAVAFLGPWRDPVRNKWVLQFGLIACAGVVPLALIAGQMRGIPFGWRMIDCSFGVFGSIPLLICLKLIRTLEKHAGGTGELVGVANDVASHA